MAEGIDVHGDKGQIDWRAVRKSGVTFAFVKASEGKTFTDARIAANLAGAKNSGIIVGPYHYARPDIRPSLSGAQEEAEAFCKVVRWAGYDPKVHGRPVLDIEVGSGDLADWAQVFCRTVERILGVTPILYSYTYFVRAHFAGRAASYELGRDYPLWLANYGPNDGTRHAVSVEAPWKELLIHQYTSNGRAPGVVGRCDRNYTASLKPLLASDPELPVLTGKQAMWAWIRWYRGHGEYKRFGPRNADVRPDVPRRVPVSWWARLLLNLGQKPSSAASGGGGSKVQ